MRRKRQAVSRRACFSSLLCWCVGTSAAKAGSGGAQAEPVDEHTLYIPLRIQVARCPGGSDQVKPRAWVEEHVQAAQAVLSRHRIRLSARHSVFGPNRCELITRAHRNEISAHLDVSNEVPVVVVERVVDLDVPTYDLMGVHWRLNGDQAPGQDRFILLGARAKPPVLAHELCHYFGLPHDPRGGNLMTPGPSSPAWASANPPQPFQPLLTDAQGTTLRKAVRSWHRR